jgi:hypothetical protein
LSMSFLIVAMCVMILLALRKSPIATKS